MHDKVERDGSQRIENMPAIYIRISQVLVIAGTVQSTLAGSSSKKTNTAYQRRRYHGRRRLALSAKCGVCAVTLKMLVTDIAYIEIE